ncbi:MAG TPA: BamA/TamA family outer membrane protein [Candidatus Binataceae bacterium]|nr:BamA/TamA family outer membrane protein [Candidatus Binataceae bacterium]
MLAASNDLRPCSRLGTCIAFLLSLFLLTLLGVSKADALTLGALEPSRTYRVAAIEFRGNKIFSDGSLEAVMTTKTRPFYEIWKKRPVFDAETFTSDLKQLQLFYQSQGYYDAHISYDLGVHGGLITPQITIREGHPVKIDSVSVEVASPAPSPQAFEPGFSLPLKPGQIFTESHYQASEQDLISIYRQHGYPHPEVKRHAVVRTGPRLAQAWYAVTPHAHAVFGRTAVTGTHKVNPRIVLRELSYSAGQPFDVREIEKSRAAILNLNLFSAVEFKVGSNPSDPHVVPITIAVQEKPKHSLNLALGYNTITELNGQLTWNDYNFLGDGRQLLVTGTYSEITAAADVQLIQPYFFSRDARLILEASQYQESYQTYMLNAPRFDPHLMYTFTPSLQGTLGYRLEYLKFNQVNPTTIDAIGGFRRDGILSGPDAGLNFNNTGDILNPQHGELLSLSGNFSDHSLGADYRYWRVVSEARKYQPLGSKTILAMRLKVGLEDTLNGKIGDVPLSERFYSGGPASVRGYGLRRIGPLSLGNDPLGGLSLIETSVELRHPLVWKLSGSVFFDCGQVSTHSFDLPVDAFQCGYGPSVGLNTPVGPANVYVGFPTKPPHGDPGYQFYFTIGPFF